MAYIISDRDDKVYIGDRNKIANKKEEAIYFKTRESACKYLKSSIPKVYKNIYTWEVREIMQANGCTENNTVNSNDRVNPSYIKIDIDNLKHSIADLSDQFTILQGNKEWLAQEESNVDRQISDILHFIEFNNFSASNGYKLCKALKDLRLRRREIKNELEMINIINCHTCNNIAKGNTSKAIAGLDNKQYTPRVLTELFESNDVNTLINNTSRLN